MTLVATSATLALITAPTADVITLAAAKQHLRVDHDNDDALITALVAAAANRLDPAGGGWLNRALRPQTWELRLDGFTNCEMISLPYPPLISITSVKYDDGDGLEQTLAPTTGYRILGTGGLGRVKVAPAYAAAWPGARSDSETVRIRYQAGYPVPTGQNPDTLPAPIVAWIKLQLGNLYEHREAVIVGASVADLPDVDGLVFPYFVFS